MMNKKPVRFMKPFETSGTLLGVDKADMFEAGMVYEIVELLGEKLIRKVGMSTITLEGGELYGCDVTTLVLSGDHLLTDKERAL